MAKTRNTQARVWAPRAKRVALLIADDVLPMRRSADGWWAAETPQLAPGADYAFSLDGSDPVADPRSGCQPQGIYGSSRVVDHAAFVWNDGAWRPPPLESAVIYEMHAGTFSSEGTFDGALARLAHLKSLGVTHVELMPVAAFPGERGWGYDGVFLYAPHHAYGGPEGLKRFVDACHREGMAVILDVVYNHLGPEGNVLPRFGDYFTQAHASPWGPAVNLDGPWSDEVRRFFCDNAIQWLRDYHCDALRVDAVHAFSDRSARPFLEQLAREVHALSAALGRQVCIIAESDLNDPRVVLPPECGGFGFDAQWSDDFHHALHALLTGERGGYYEDFGALADLAKAYADVFVYDGRFSQHRRRAHGRSLPPVSRARFLAYAQNHDQVGNRARGERISQLVDERRLRLAAAAVLCSPFIPMIFQGEEWGASTPFQYFTDLQDDELGLAVREGRRREFAAFGWKPEDVPDPQASDTFERSKLDWAEMKREPHRGLLKWYGQLIRLRRGEPALAAGRPAAVRYDEKKRWLVLVRGNIAAVFNFGEAPQRVPLPRGEWGVLLASHARLEGQTADLEGWGAAILRGSEVPER